MLPDASFAVVKVAAAGVAPPITVPSKVPPLTSAVVATSESMAILVSNLALVTAPSAM
jgi:hypothetical protein